MLQKLHELQLDLIVELLADKARKTYGVGAFTHPSMYAML